MRCGGRWCFALARRDARPPRAGGQMGKETGYLIVNILVRLFGISDRKQVAGVFAAVELAAETFEGLGVELADAGAADAEGGPDFAHGHVLVVVEDEHEALGAGKVVKEDGADVVAVEDLLGAEDAGIVEGGAVVGGSAAADADADEGGGGAFELVNFVGADADACGEGFGDGGFAGLHAGGGVSGGEAGELAAFFARGPLLALDAVEHGAVDAAGTIGFKLDAAFRIEAGDGGAEAQGAELDEIIDIGPADAAPTAGDTQRGKADEGQVVHEECVAVGGAAIVEIGFPEGFRGEQCLGHRLTPERDTEGPEAGGCRRGVRAAGARTAGGFCRRGEEREKIVNSGGPGRRQGHGCSRCPVQGARVGCCEGGGDRVRIADIRRTEPWGLRQRPCHNSAVKFAWDR